MSKQLTMEEMQQKIERLEERVEQLEQERDHARDAAIWNRLQIIIKRNNLTRLRNTSEHLSNSQIKDIQMGNLTVEDAVTQRNERWPLFKYWDGEMTLDEAFQRAL